MAADIEVFISHSSKDNLLAEAVTDLLVGTIDFLGAVRCTSAYGHSLDIGTKVAKRLRKEISNCDVFIALISKNSLASQFCLFELGAAWGQKIPIKPILAPNFDAFQLHPPLSDFHCLKWDSGEEWIRLIKSVAKLTVSDRKKGSIVRAAVSKFCQKKF